MAGRRTAARGGEVTIREAFAKAGHPVPDKAIICYAFDAHYQDYDMIDCESVGKVVEDTKPEWWWVYLPPFRNWAIFNDDEWEDPGNLMAPVRSQWVDMGNLPAISAYGVLPEKLKPIVLDCQGEPCLECILNGMCLGLEDAKEFNR